ncbi:MAG: hypothetical protein GF398_03670 [Chitinivibrionales bacterium]|nr:hypothetical protein [Chitinivibrionales bacterium]
MSIHITVDAGSIAKPFTHFYRAFGYANADYTSTAPSRRMYDYLSSFHGHARYMRLHNILTLHGDGDKYLVEEGQSYGNPRKKDSHYDKVVRVDANGKLVFDFSLVDEVYDIILSHNMKPIVETVWMPTCLWPDGATDVLTPPRDFAMWADVLTHFVTHLQERYGKEEVRHWYFELWNEPDGIREYRESHDLLCKLYDYFEHAIHGVDSEYKTGGPATMQRETSFGMFESFLEHCANGYHYLTGEQGARLDFISVHCKGGRPDSYCPSTETLFNSLKRYCGIIGKYPQFHTTQFFNDESDIVWDGNLGVKHESWLNFRNTHYFPGFICKMVSTYCTQIEDCHNVNLSIVDSDNCHLQWEREYFGGYRSQLTPLMSYPSTDLIKKPAFNAYVLLSKLRDQRLRGECDDEGFGRKFGVLPTLDDDSLAVMVWNFEDGINEDVNARDVHLSVSNIPFFGEYLLLHYRIDYEYSNAHGCWSFIRSTENELTAGVIEEIRSKEGLELCDEVQCISLKGAFECGVHLPMHAVSLFLLVPVNQSPPAAPQILRAAAEKGYCGNDQVFLKWGCAPEKDLLMYRVFRRDDQGREDEISDQTMLNTATFIDMHARAGQTYEYFVTAVNASKVESSRSVPVKVKV